jgi:hypothetical protein
MSLCCRIVALLLLPAATMLPGCGRKTALIPPQDLLPVAIGDLHYRLDENGVTLRWTYPSELKNGDDLFFIESFEVLRAEIPEEQFCEGCPVKFEEPVKIAGGYLPESGESRTADYTEGNLQYGYRYLYKVRSLAEGRYRGEDSNVISFTWRPPPKAPQGLQVEPGDRRIALIWQPVRENIQDDDLSVPPSYRVYRKKGEGQFIELGGLVQKPAFIDVGLENDTSYSYRVRAFVKIAQTLQAGEASTAISAVPRDLTPPPSPQELVAIATPAGVKLAWQAVTGADIAGYRIYRREENAQQAQLIAEVGTDRNQYVDQDNIIGRKLFYSITSFDRAEPVNESQPSQEVIIGLR